jgi:hypothetical protein
LSKKTEIIPAVIGGALGIILAACIAFIFFFAVDFFRSAQTYEYEITSEVSAKNYSPAGLRTYCIPSENGVTPCYRYYPEKYSVTLKYDSYSDSRAGFELYSNCETGGEVPAVLKITKAKNGKVIFTSITPKSA